MNSGFGGYPASTLGMGAHGLLGFPGGNRVSQGLPSVLSLSTVWFSADSLNLANGDPVGSWVDLNSGLIAAPSGNAPTYAANVVNGSPAVRFTASNSQRLLVNYSPLFTWLNGGHCFVVMKTAALSTGVLRNIIGNSDSSGYGWEIRYRDIIEYQITGNVLGANYVLSTSNFQLLECSYNMVTQDIFLQGASVASTARSTAVTQNGKGLYIGETGPYGGSGLNRYMDGWIAEIVIFNAPLTTTQTAEVRTYLNSKYVLY